MQLTGWDIAILAVAAYVAVMVLVRMMRKRREVIEATFKERLQQEKARLAEHREREKEEERLSRLRKTVHDFADDNNETP